MSSAGNPVFESDQACVEGFSGQIQSIEAVRDADDLPLVFQEGALHCAADDRVAAWLVSAAGADPDAADSPSLHGDGQGTAVDPAKTGSDVGGRT